MGCSCWMAIDTVSSCKNSISSSIPRKSNSGERLSDGLSDLAEAGKKERTTMSELAVRLLTQYLTKKKGG